MKKFNTVQQICISTSSAFCLAVPVRSSDTATIQLLCFMDQPPCSAVSSLGNKPPRWRNFSHGISETAQEHRYALLRYCLIHFEVVLSFSVIPTLPPNSERLLTTSRWRPSVKRWSPYIPNNKAVICNCNRSDHFPRHQQLILLTRSLGIPPLRNKWP